MAQDEHSKMRNSASGDAQKANTKHLRLEGKTSGLTHTVYTVDTSNFNEQCHQQNVEII